VERNGSIRFKFTRFGFVREPWCRIGKIVIRKDHHTIVECELCPSEGKNRVSYALTVSRDVIGESEFVFSELAILKIQGDDGKEVAEVRGGDGTVYRFCLRDYAK